MSQGKSLWKKLGSILSQFLKSLWLFFPGILFLLLGIACFWIAGQGKDIILAFGSNKARSIQIAGFQWNYSRIVFFISISFWAYVSWYSSRIIFYIKLQKQLDPIIEIEKTAHVSIAPEGESFPEIHKNFLIEFPRMIGNACFLVLELALIQSPLVSKSVSMPLAFVLLALLLIIFYYLNRWIVSSFSYDKLYWPLFRYLGIAFLISLFITSFIEHVGFVSLLLHIIALHVIYIIYTNLHRKDMQSTRMVSTVSTPRLFRRGMNYFCIPPTESGYFTWFIYTGIIGFVLYLLAINSFHFARGIGPFSFILLAFGVLLAFGNLVTALSVKSKINYHFVIFALTLVFGLIENHKVRVKPRNVAASSRPNLDQYLRAWLAHSPNKDSGAIDMYFVMSNGGASRSGYWTAAVLGKMQDSTALLQNRTFSDQLFCLSGTSGGAVGVASYFSLLRDKEISQKLPYESSLKAFLKQDYFTFTFAGLLGPDYFHYLLFFIKGHDRAGKLEESFEQSGKLDDTLRSIPFEDDLASFPALANGKVNLPLLFLNTTRTQDGNPGVVSNLEIDSVTFNNRVDVVKLLSKTNNDISIATAAILSARFPYLSPAGKISDSYFVDGGYFDNSGAGVVQELIRGIINIGKNDSDRTDSLARRITRIHYHVLHIINSPDIYDSTGLKRITPIQNDLFAPVLTILGAYDMQTTVNDRRLFNYLQDLKHNDHIAADYTKISLYKSTDELRGETGDGGPLKKELAYPMNWFISDSTLTRMDIRLSHNDSLKAVIRQLRDSLQKKF